MLDPARLLTGMRGQLDISKIDDIKLNYLRYKPGMNLDGLSSTSCGNSGVGSGGGGFGRFRG
jgi:uncharacterized membrane protein